MTEKPRIFIDLTMPTIGQAVLHVQREGGELQQFDIEREQLFKINHQAADILMKGQGK